MFRWADRGSGEFWQVWNDLGVRNEEPSAEMIPECNAELGAGVHQGEEGVGAVTSIVTAGVVADLPLYDVAADVSLRAIGVQWYLRPIEHHHPRESGEDFMRLAGWRGSRHPRRRTFA